MTTRKVSVPVTTCDVCEANVDSTNDHYAVGFFDGVLELDLCERDARLLWTLREKCASQFKHGRARRIRAARARGIHPVHESELPPAPEEATA